MRPFQLLCKIKKLTQNILIVTKGKAVFSGFVLWLEIAYTIAHKFLKSSWLVYNGKWYYLDFNEYMVTHWVKIQNGWYYFHGTGEMIKKDWAQDEAKKPCYYCDKYGKMDTSKIIDWKGKRYYVEEDGAMAVNKTIVDPETGKLMRQMGRVYLLSSVYEHIAQEAGVP